MKALNAFSATVVLLFGGATTVLAQSVPFEAQGFPITLHQAQVIGLADIHERPPDLIATLDGMPLSPLQALVLEPRSRMTQEEVAERLAGAGYTNVIFEAPSDYTVSATITGPLAKSRTTPATGATR